MMSSNNSDHPVDDSFQDAVDEIHSGSEQRDVSDTEVEDTKTKLDSEEGGAAGESSTGDNDHNGDDDGDDDGEEIPNDPEPSEADDREGGGDEGAEGEDDGEQEESQVPAFDEVPLDGSEESGLNGSSAKSLDEKLEELAVEEGKDNDEAKLQPAAIISPPILPSRENVTSNSSADGPVLPPRDLETSGSVAPPPPPRDTDAAKSERPVPPPPPPRDVNAAVSEEEHAPPLPERHDIFKTAASLTPPPLPPQLTHTQKQHHRSTISSWFHRGDSSGSSGPRKSTVEYDENYDLLLSRLDKNHEAFSAKDDVLKAQINSAHETLKSTFADKLTSLEDETSVDDSELKIDWPFWTRVVNDYPSVVKSDAVTLSNHLSGGIPEQIRGIVWQLVSNSNPQEFEDVYNVLKDQESKSEKAIQKDLSRTSFISDVGLDQDALYRVIKAYSNMDEEVGYTQGMAFITVPLLINMDELQAFSLLHKIMYDYNARSLYLPEMPGLVLKLYQFDRLVEDLLPNLYNHFQRQGIRSSMYASQWFLTFFAYKFPLQFVMRIFDLIITEGVESILKFAVALVQKNEEKLLTLNFDDLLNFLKGNLFDVYSLVPVSEQSEEDEAKVPPSRTVPITPENYDVDAFVDEATKVKLLPMTLKRYENEWKEVNREEKERREEVDQLKLRNTQLGKEIKNLEASYTILNREHVQIANELITGRIKIAELEDEAKDLKEQNQNLRNMVKSLQENPISENVPIPEALEADLKRTMERNLEVMSQNQELEDQVQSLLQEVEELKAKLKEHEEQPATSPTEEKTASSPPKQQGLWGKKLFG